MNVNLITDAPKHNLALMKLSAYYKAMDCNVWLNGVGEFDYTIGSWLFSNSPKGPCDYEGGPGIDPTRQLDFPENAERDYDLYNIDYSLGYTWRYCPRKCPFCIVPLQGNSKDHYSIWSFHKDNFKKICLLNNNTFSDPHWKNTFEEIWKADLTVIDENGYDLRLLDDEKADALKRTKFQGCIHFAWDRLKDETKILSGLAILERFKIKSHVYVLVGFESTREEDFYRCQKIIDYGHDPYVMPFNKTKDEKAFKRFIDSFMWRKYPTLKAAWREYKRGAKVGPKMQGRVYSMDFSR